MHKLKEEMGAVELKCGALMRTLKDGLHSIIFESKLMSNGTCVLMASALSDQDLTRDTFMRDDEPACDRPCQSGDFTFSRANGLHDARASRCDVVFGVKGTHVMSSSIKAREHDVPLAAKDKDVINGRDTSPQKVVRGCLETADRAPTHSRNSATSAYMNKAVEACLDYAVKSSCHLAKEEVRERGYADSVHVHGEGVHVDADAGGGKPGTWSVDDKLWGSTWMDAAVAKEEAVRLKKERDDARNRLSRVSMHASMFVYVDTCMCVYVERDDARNRLSGGQYACIYVRICRYVYVERDDAKSRLCKLCMQAYMDVSVCKHV